MVKLTVYDHADSFALTDYIDVSTVLTQTLRSGVTDYLFSDSDAYAAKMFAIRDATGAWQGDLFFGHSIVLPTGRAGFAPDARVEGFVGGQSVDAFAADYYNGSNDPGGFGAQLFAGRDNLIGGKGADSLEGFAGRDFIDGGDGDDILMGGEGPDRIFGGDGDDILMGGKGSDRIFGGAGNDRISGGDGSDIIHTGTGTSHPGSGNPFVYGDAGNDTIYVEAGFDFFIYGGTGADRFVFTDPNQAINFISDFRSGTDHIVLDAEGFTALKDGLSRDNFVAGSRATDADDRLIYDGRVLYYDPDGSGPTIQTRVTNASGIAFEDIEILNENLVSASLVVAPSLVDFSSHHGFLL